MKVLTGLNIAKIMLVFNSNVKTIITIAKNEKMIFDILSDLLPTSKNADFYLKVESDVQSPNKDFYHDANGYLVMRRELDKRPDFDFTIAPGDTSMRIPTQLPASHTFVTI